MAVQPERERNLAAWLGARQEAMIALLAELVNLDSGTGNGAGIDAVAGRIAAFLEAAGLRPARVCDTPCALRAEVGAAEVGAAEAERKSILLMGHLDTVFPDGEARRRPFRREGARGRGPGVADMKAGLVMNCFVLAAFKALGDNRRPLVGLFTSDEEIGSPRGRSLVEAEARKAAYAFNAEPARASGNVVDARRGGAFMRLSIEGKAAHAGIDLRAGISAIDEMAHKIIALHGLTDFDRGVTVNVGVVSGGQSVNTTAPTSQALIDMRFSQSADRDRLMAAIAAIVERSWTPGSSARLEITGEFLPLAPSADSRRVFAAYQAAARDLGFTVEAVATGGCADSGFAAAMGAVTLCGLGPVGGHAHSPDEYVELDTVAPRAQALALTILRLQDEAAAPSCSPTPDVESDPAPRGSRAANRKGLA